MTPITMPGGSVVEVPEKVVELEGVTIHEHKARLHTVERWRLEKFQAIQASYTAELQEIENALWNVMISRFVDYAQGAQLDLLGRIVGEARGDKTDPNYRVRLRARIAINASMGRAKDIITVLRLLDPAVVRLTDLPPASLEVEFLEPPTGVATHTELANLLTDARAAGIGGSLIMPTVDEGAFQFAHSPTLNLIPNVGDQAVRTGAGTLNVPWPFVNKAGDLAILFAEGNVETPPSGWTLIESEGVFQTTAIYARLVPSQQSGNVAWTVTSTKSARILTISPPDFRAWKSPVLNALSTLTGTGTGVNITGIPAAPSGSFTLVFLSGWGSTYTVSTVPAGWSLASQDAPSSPYLGMAVLSTAVDAAAGNVVLAGGSGTPSWSWIYTLLASDPIDGEHGFSDDSDGEGDVTPEGGLLADQRNF